MTIDARAEPDLREVSERIGSLIATFADEADERAVERVQDLVRLLMQLYGSGLGRVVAALGEADSRLLERIAEDDLVASLLVLHDLHPVDVQTRMERALDRVRPYLGSHGGEVEILGLEGDVARVRMGGSCDGCPSSSVTLVSAIERAILDAAPEVSRVEAEGVTPAPVAGGLIQLEPRRGAPGGPAAPSNGSNGSNGAGVWLEVGTPVDPPPERPSALVLGGIPILICRADGQLYAYRDLCPGCGGALRGARLTERILACPSCEARYDVRLAGRSIGGGETHLEPLPLLSDAGSVRICVPSLAH